MDLTDALEGDCKSSSGQQVEGVFDIFKGGKDKGDCKGKSHDKKGHDKPKDHKKHKDHKKKGERKKHGKKHKEGKEKKCKEGGSDSSSSSSSSSSDTD